jgi:hypothetical protein
MGEAVIAAILATEFAAVLAAVFAAASEKEKAIRKEEIRKIAAKTKIELKILNRN